MENPQQTEQTLALWRERVRAAPRCDEADTIRQRIAQTGLTETVRNRISQDAEQWVVNLRASTQPGLMESLLAEYGLSDEEGLALMCLAEAYLRVPDTGTIDELIRDKIGTGQWSRHAGAARSMLVNASTWGLMLSGEVFRGGADAPGRSLPNALGVIGKLKQRVGEPVVRLGVGAAMRVMGQQFVLGRTIEEAINRSQQARKDGYRFSFDMLGEAARTAQAAAAYFDGYAGAIEALRLRAKMNADVFDNPGISVKLSALHPRYELVQSARVAQELVPRVTSLARMAAAANIGFNIDAEEANRLDISLDVIEAVLRDPALRGWDGFGIVVQAYSKSSLAVLNWFYGLARELKSRVAVRLVKGAYWDMEIKQAQMLGLSSFPVFTRKPSTDVSYLAGARFLLDHGDWIYPQFASHNAHTIAAVVVMSEQIQGAEQPRFEFQRLHGMGESLHQQVLARTGRICRVYAPVGEHEDLLAYLVRRMLENGANSSFVNQLMDERIRPAALVADPISAVLSRSVLANDKIPLPVNLFGNQRQNSTGWDVNDVADQRDLDRAIAPFLDTQWHAAPSGLDRHADAVVQSVLNPVNRSDRVGTVCETPVDAVTGILARARQAHHVWARTTSEQRAGVLDRTAALYEQHAGELISMLIREAGKHRLDAIAELREAVDFCRYYAQQAREGPEQSGAQARGVFVCISPWNFPLAIFTGQVVAALVAGNAVVAKPAEQTTLVGARAVELMHMAGVPTDVLMLTPGSGAVIGAALCASADVDGVCFTGSTGTALQIDRSLAQANPYATLIAETGGINAMVVDSTALLEASVRDIVQSAFQSAGQRCSALRVLFVQEDIADDLLTMLAGATRELGIGDPLFKSVDVGPLIDASAHRSISAYCQRLTANGQRLFGGESVAELVADNRLSIEPAGLADPQRIAELEEQLLAPVAFAIESLNDLAAEVFGPVLHVIRFASGSLDAVVEQINQSGYGLTFGLHSRIDHRVRDICYRIRAGNVYVNRNQIGAVVGVQPFGGEGLSGTGPKAGGPNYVAAFTRAVEACSDATLPRLKPAQLTEIHKHAGASEAAARDVDWHTSELAALMKIVHQPAGPGRAAALQQKINLLPAAWRPQTANWFMQGANELEEELLVGPTGEANRLRAVPRGPMLCLGSQFDPEQADGPPPSAQEVSELATQAVKCLAVGNPVLLSGPGRHVVARIMAGWLAASDLPDHWVTCVTGSQAMALTGQDQAGTQGLAGLVLDSDAANWVTFRVRLAAGSGARVPLLNTASALHRFALERVITVDTTASGGNASLLNMESEPLAGVDQQA